MVKCLMCAARNLFYGVLLCALPWGMALALIDISPKEAEILGGTLSVSVINTGDKPEFVEIMLYQLGNPGVPPEQEQLIPLGKVKDPYLYAVPFKLSLGPRQQKQVHLKTLRQPDREMVYRLSVLPKQQVAIRSTKNNIMLVGLGYLGLIRQLPSTKIASWHHYCEADDLRLEATGTVRVEFSELTSGEQSVDDFNVYPGTPRHIAAHNLSGKIQNIPFSIQCGAA